MYNKKFIFVLILFILTVGCSSAVYANDSNMTVEEAVSNDVLEINQDETLSTTYSVDGTSFSDIQTVVDNANDGDTIKISGNYTGSWSQIEVKKSLNFVGDSATLDAKGNSRIFNVLHSDVTFKGINFVNAYSYSYGGAIYFNDNCENFLIEDCNFTNCHGDYGGAIFLSGYYGTAVNCNFKDCTATYHGGAIMWMSASNCTFENNHANERGGAMLSGFARECRFINNTAGSTGGAIERGISYGCYFEGNSNPETYETTIHSIVNASLKVTQSGSQYNDKKLTIKVTDSATGKGLYDNTIYSSFYKITVKFSNGKTVFLEPNSNGIATYDIPFAPGTYSATVSLDSDLVNSSPVRLSGINIAKSDATITPVKLSTTYGSGKNFQIKVTNSQSKNPIANVKLTVKVYTGKKYNTFKITSNEKGIAKLDTSKLSVGTHKVVISKVNTNFVSAKSKTSSIKISKATISIVAPKATNVFKQSGTFKATVKNKASGKPISGIKVTFKVFTGKKYKTYTVKTNSKGEASIQTKSLSQATHKVMISTPANSNYKAASKKSSIAISKTKLKTSFVFHRMLYNYYANGALKSVTVNLDLVDSNGEILHKKITGQIKRDYYGGIDDYGDLSTGTSGSPIEVNKWIGSWTTFVQIDFAGDSKYQPARFIRYI